MKKEIVFRFLPFPAISLWFLIFLFLISCKTEPEKEPFLLGKGPGIDKTTLVVNDLKAAQAYYRDTLGFKIFDRIESGVYDGSSSISIYLPDLYSFEILSFQDSTALADSTPAMLPTSEFNEKVRFYSLWTSSVDSASAWLGSKGFEMDSVRSFRSSKTVQEGWSGDHGEPQTHSLTFGEGMPLYFPQFNEYSDFPYQIWIENKRMFYATLRRSMDHENGVVGLKHIRISSSNLKAQTKVFHTMGFKEGHAGDDFVSFNINDHQELIFEKPFEVSNVSQSLVARENALEAVRFEVKNLDSTYNYFQQKLPEEALIRKEDPKHLVISEAFTLGVQLEFVEESREQGATLMLPGKGEALGEAEAQYAAGLYDKYCALCHGDDRQGYTADNAPSLRSHSLLATSKESNFMRYTIMYGREGTAMGGYYKSRGGPLDVMDIELLLAWLYDQSEVEEAEEISREPVSGDLVLGSEVYANYCASCHGDKGEGTTAPALGNSMLLATATDHFLRYAIAEGRDGTPMPAFKDSLSKEEIDGVTAFLRTRASGWDVPSNDTIPVPTPEEYVLNPGNESPDFNLKDGLYVPATEVYAALMAEKKMVILDARSEVAWRQTHIPGAIPVPYYEEPENFIDDIPNDDTWIVAYCACPHAASKQVVNTLRRYGYKNTAIIDEGILVWAQMGYPVSHGN